MKTHVVDNKDKSENRACFVVDNKDKSENAACFLGET